MSAYPYADRFPVLRGMPSEGRDRNAIITELRDIATAEDKTWETGKCSGTMYCGDHQHYDFMNEVFGMYSHMNVLQRDMCPSATRFEGEIIAMTLDLMHGADAQSTDDGPVGLITSGGSGSILHSVLAYREWARTVKGIAHPNIIKPETAHPAFNKACHLVDVELRQAPVDPATAQVDLGALASLIDENTAAMIGSACNYGYGTIDPIEEMGRLAVDHEIGLHVDGCLGGFILPWGEQLGYDIPPFDFRVPGVTSISADTHKYAYGLKGTSVLLFRDKILRNGQYFYLTDWTGGKYCSPGIDGSRSGGLLAATWAGMVSLGREGYLRYARAIFETAFAMQEAVNAHSELRLIGSPTFCFSFTSDDFDIYHVNDFMRTRGWRFNGQQYPNSIHMAVTRPQTQDGLADTFAIDLDEAVLYAVDHKDEPAKSSAIYGGVEGGPSADSTAFIEAVMAGMMDEQQALPPVA
jgi:sphinganine-1-phosphate aldolase